MKKSHLQEMRKRATRESRIENLEERGKEMDIVEASEYLGLKISTMRKLVFAREIPSYLFFKRRIFFENELLAYKQAIMSLI